jgi:hypothetical protein
MDPRVNSFYSISSKDLKKICKLNGMKNISKIRKNDLIRDLLRLFSIVKIQRFFRNSFGNDTCPISMSKIVYPMYPFRPKGQRIFIYYNLKDLVEYLLSSGDFRDPETRQEYSSNDLQLINDLKKQNKIPGKSIISAHKNIGFYKKKKENEDDILIIERCLDDIISSMRNLLIDADRRRHAQHTLHNLLFLSFRMFFKRFVQISDISGSHALLDRTISIINETVDRSIEKSSEIELIRDSIIQFLYQLKFDELSEDL